MHRTRMTTLPMLLLRCGAVLTCGLFAAAAFADGSKPTCPPIHLTPPTFSTFSSFGFSTAMDGDRAIIGRLNGVAEDGFAGSAYVYRREGAKWVVDGHLTSPDSEVGDWLGHRVAIHGETALATALQHVHGPGFGGGEGVRLPPWPAGLDLRA